MRTGLFLGLVMVGCQGSDDDKTTEPADPPTDGTDPGSTDDEETTPPGTLPTTDSGTIPSEATTWEDPVLPATVVSGLCDGYLIESWGNPAPTVPELHSFGIYRSDGVDDVPGQVTIEVDRAYAPMTLALSSYELEDWTVVYDPAVSTIDRVILNGYYLQNVTFVLPSGDPVVAPPPVDNQSPYQNSLGAYPFSTQNGYYLNETLAFIGDIEVFTGLDATSFWGCYRSVGFRIQ